ncbi:histone-lysine N-methyltransferase SETMAR [Trichonephila clavipes]|uniref:Histone-lysine N-methyltransferase SETMAR n=1 Tax=Trichonephila clavipes TaxID=2585209 RepID=A0A8X6UQQ8_TRICX|nr:histone-lysine N-methyltransferase SETMAR [Trichonephila clavipes]
MVTSKKNSTSAVPECTASCSKLGKESFSTAEEMPGPVFGNRIVDLELIVEAFAQLCCPKCFAEKVELFEDSRYGLCSHFTLKWAFKLCSTLNWPRLTKAAYKNQEAKLLKVVQEVAEESMIKAATEIVEKQQNLSSDRVKCGILVDGTWQRRSYTSMNGCVAAISVDTGKVLDIEVRSSYCPTYIVNVRTCQILFSKFRSKELSLQESDRSRRPFKIDNDVLRFTLENNPHLTSQQTAEELGIHHTTVGDHIKSLGFVLQRSVWVPRELTEHNLSDRVRMCSSHLIRHNMEPFFDKLITGDEKWILYENIKRKKCYCKPGTSSATVPKPSIHQQKILLCLL